MRTIQLFLQFEGDRRIELVRVAHDATVGDLIAAARRAGLPDDRTDGALVFGHEGDAPLDPDAALTAAGIGDKHRVHVHRCRKVGSWTGCDPAARCAPNGRWGRQSRRTSETTVRSVNPRT